MTISAFSEALFTIDWGDADPRPIRCPVTGAIVAAGYDPSTGEFSYEGVPKWAEIPTVLFVHTEMGGFQFVRADLQAQIDQVRQELITAGGDEDELDGFRILAEHLDSIGKVPIVFEIVTRGAGRSGGPLTTTVYVGLDLTAALSDFETPRLNFADPVEAAAPPEFQTPRLNFAEPAETDALPEFQTPRLNFAGQAAAPSEFATGPNRTSSEFQTQRLNFAEPTRASSQFQTRSLNLGRED
jgi:hypothetical protein